MNLIIRLAFLMAAVTAVGTASAQTLYTPGASVGNSTNGSVGIGTATPNAKLDIQLSGLTVGLRLHNSISSTNWDLYAYNDNNFYLNNANGSVVNIFSSAAGGTLYIGGDRIGVDTLNMLRPLTVEGGSSAGVNQGLVINSAHAYGVGQGAASSALVFGRNRSTDTTALNSSAQIVGGNESETTSNNGFLGFYTLDGVGNLLERMRLDSGGNIGIGTINPAAALHLWHQSTNGAVIAKVENASTGPGTQARVDFATGTPNGYAMINLQDNQGAPYFQFTVGPAVVASYYDAPQHVFRKTDGTEWLRIVNGNVGIGTATPTQKLSVSGAIRAKEVIVDTNWSDYIFDDDYRLASLSEVEQKIRLDKHLPGMPSAREVAEKGISVGQMEAKLLAEIEKITLHQIALEKENDALRNRVAKLEKSR